MVEEYATKGGSKGDGKINFFNRISYIEINEWEGGGAMGKRVARLACGQLPLTKYSDCGPAFGRMGWVGGLDAGGRRICEQ